MTGVEWVLIALVLACGFYAAWNIGANDVANAMGTSVGSGALTLGTAVLLAAIFEFLGAYIAGADVSDTVRKKMFDPEALTVIYGAKAHFVLAIGMIASLMAAGTWLLVATWAHWPVSTTHSIVGAVVGFGCVALGINGVAWNTVGVISLGWVVSPIISGAIAYFVFGIILRLVFFKRDPVRAAKKVMPYLVFVLVVVLCGVTAYKGLKPVWKRLKYEPFSFEFISVVVVISCVLGLVGWFIARRMMSKYQSTSAGAGGNPVLGAEVSRSLGKAIKHLRRVRTGSDGEIQERAEQLLKEIEQVEGMAQKEIASNTDSEELRQVEKIFVILQIMTACLVAFAHGSNDVANAIGPLSAAYSAIKGGVIAAKSTTPSWALALGGIGIVIGLATWGWKVIKTVGEKITELTPSRGFCAEFAAAITILLASTMGLPLSTTHTLVGAVLGVGLARGISALNLKTMRDIVAGWAITIPVGALLSIIFYYILYAIFIYSGWVDTAIVAA